jgi:hypothetical protein
MWHHGLSAGVTYRLHSEALTAAMAPDRRINVRT